MRDKNTEVLTTVADFLRYAMTQMQSNAVYFGHGTDNVWDEALQLVMGALHLPVDLPATMLEAKLSLSERAQMLTLIKRRAVDRVPAPYLTGKAWFAGVEFYIDERALIPRSPFAELIASSFEPWLSEQPQTILELCTGSGCIAIALENVFPDADIVATDISFDALQVAAQNKRRHQSEVEFLQADVFEGVTGTYDLIVSNPPYVTTKDLADSPAEFHHEPRLALAAGVDGLDIVRRILAGAVNHLSDQGVLVVEVGASAEDFVEHFADCPVTWLDFEQGGEGVFLIERSELAAFLKS